MNTAQFISIFNSGGNPLGPFQERVEADGGTVEGLDNMLAKYDASASWQLIPSAVKAGTAYAQVPNSSLGDLTVTRASSGTYTDSAGVVQTAASNVLRTDYRNADGTLSATGRYLLEPQRTNSIRNSADLNSWLKLDTSVTTNTLVSPSGLQDADTVVATGAGPVPHLIYQNLAFTSGTAYSMSVFAKANTSNFIQLSFAGNFGSNSYANFDLSNGTITASAFVTAKIENYGNGWYRCSISATALNTSTNSQIIYLINSGTAPRAQSFTASGESVYLWGGQFEAGAYATTYIQTTTAAVTRLADTASKTGVSSLIGQTEGTVFLELIGNRTAINQNIELGDGTGSNRLVLRLTGTNQIQFALVQGGSVQQSILSSSTFAQGERLKIAIGYKTSNSAFYLNGVQIGIASTGTVFGFFTGIYFNHSGNGTEVMNSPVNQSALFPTRLDNAQLAQLTTL